MRILRTHADYSMILLYLAINKSTPTFEGNNMSTMSTKCVYSTTDDTINLPIHFVMLSGNFITATDEFINHP